MIVRVKQLVETLSDLDDVKNIPAGPDGLDSVQNYPIEEEEYATGYNRVLDAIDVKSVGVAGFPEYRAGYLAALVWCRKQIHKEACLDVLHDTIPIGHLDDFEITVQCDPTEAA